MTRTRKIFLSAFIFFNLLVMLRMSSGSSGVLTFLSLHQSWPSLQWEDSSKTITAQVEFNDGSYDVFDFSPSANQMKNYNFMWNDSTKFALRKLKPRNFHKIPLKVRLVDKNANENAIFFTREVI